MTIVVSPYSGSTPATSHVITLTSQAVAGRRLLLAACAGATISDPSGWTQVGNVVSTEAVYLWTKTADGTETQVTLTLAASRGCAAVVVERDDCTTLLSGGAQGNGSVSGGSVSGVAGTFNATGTAVVVGVLARASISGIAGLTSTPTAPWVERADIAVDASSNEDPWLTLVDQVNVADGTYTPQVTTSATLPGSAVRGITAAFEYTNPLPPAENPIEAENRLTGNSSAEWQVSGAGNTSCMGYAPAASYPRGGTAQFKIHCPASACTVEIFRLGYYGALGARKVATVAATQTTQPAGTVDPTTQALDCGNWSVNASWSIPADACPGVYVARPKLDSAPAEATQIPFVVRDTTRKAPLCVVLSDTTWQAYNYYGGPGAELAGKSLYGQGAGADAFNLSVRSYAVSFNRPYVTRDARSQTYLFNAEYPLIRWLERCGYDLDYLSSLDVEADPTLLLGRDAVISSGHDEYWSQAKRDGFLAARDHTSATQRANLVFLSGNEVFWRVRFTGGVRTMVCYKDTHNNGVQIDPLEWTGTWQDTRWASRQPPELVDGQTFIANGIRADTIAVPTAYQASPLWRNCGLSGPSATLLPAGTLGFEWDTPGTPPTGATVAYLSETTVDITGYKSDANGQNYNLSGTAVHKLLLMQVASGALVFAAGTTQWAWGLDSVHDRGSASPSAAVQQATLNLLADLAVPLPPAASLPAGMTMPTPATLADYGLAEVTVPTTTPHLVTLAQAKAFLRLKGTADDALLDLVVGWASAAILRRLPGATETVTETVKAEGSLVLARTPLIAITSVTAVGPYDPVISAANLRITSALGGVAEPAAGPWPCGTYTVVYTAGHAALPVGVDGACLVLVRHWWNQTQAHGSSTYGDAGIVPDFNDLPNTVLNMLATTPRLIPVA